MRIWHQSFTVLQDLGAYEKALREHFKRVARPDTEIVLHGMHPGTYRSNYPGEDIRHASLQYLHSMQFFAAALRAQEEGFDAYAISTLPEPGLREIRGLVGIPVVGYGESAMLTSCMLGQRFGVLLFIQEMGRLIEDNVRGHGLQERFAGVRDVGFRFKDVLAAYDDPTDLFRRFETAARDLIAHGADVIIPGEAPLCVLLAAHGVSSVDGVPVLDSLSAWIKSAEALVDLRVQSGVRGCSSGYFHEPPKAERLKELARFYHLDEFARNGEAAEAVPNRAARKS
jgi:Asp/Glu/hydantoin racemase